MRALFSPVLADIYLPMQSLFLSEILRRNGRGQVPVAGRGGCPGGLQRGDIYTHCFVRELDPARVSERPPIDCERLGSTCALGGKR
jgi:hypothetical protein